MNGLINDNSEQIDSPPDDLVRHHLIEMAKKRNPP